MTEATFVLCPQCPPPLHADAECSFRAGHQHPPQRVRHIHQADSDRQLFGSRPGRLVSSCPNQTFSFTFTRLGLEIVRPVRLVAYVSLRYDAIVHRWLCSKTSWSVWIITPISYCDQRCTECCQRTVILVCSTYWLANVSIALQLFFNSPNITVRVWVTYVPDRMRHTIFNPDVLVSYLLLILKGIFELE